MGGVWGVGCGVWVWCVVCGVWCVVCGVWCVGGVWVVCGWCVGLAGWGEGREGGGSWSRESAPEVGETTSGEGVTSAFSLTAVTEMSPEGKLPGLSTECRSRPRLLGVTGLHGLRGDWVPNLADSWPAPLRVRSGGQASLSVKSVFRPSRSRQDNSKNTKVELCSEAILFVTVLATMQYAMSKVLRHQFRIGVAKLFHDSSSDPHTL